MALKFGTCGCDTPTLARVRRSWWMKLCFPAHRFYACSHCGTQVLSRVPPQAEHSFEASQFWRSLPKPMTTDALRSLDNSK